MYFCRKACSKNDSLLERVDSRVQHIWRLQVMGSWIKSRLDLRVPLTFRTVGCVCLLES